MSGDERMRDFSQWDEKVISEKMDRQKNRVESTMRPQIRRV
jgi:hypothetical protein